MSDAADQAAAEASDRVLTGWGADYRQDELRDECRDMRCSRINGRCVGYHCGQCGEPCGSQGHRCRPASKEEIERLNAGLAALRAQADEDQGHLANQADAIIALNAKVDALSALLRGMARRASRLRRHRSQAQSFAEIATFDAVKTVAEHMARNGQLRAELAALRAQLSRAVVLPNAWNTKLVDAAHSDNPLRRVAELIESWRAPEQNQAGSTGDASTAAEARDTEGGKV